MEKIIIKSCPFCGADGAPYRVGDSPEYTHAGCDHECHGFPEPIELWQNRPIEDALRAEAERLRLAAKEALEWLKNAPFDYSNGVKDSTGTLDEGNVYGWQGHGEIVEKLEKALEEIK